MVRGMSNFKMFDPSKLLKCYRTYGFANGYYRGLGEVPEIAKLSTVCGKCRRTKFCSRTSIAVAKCTTAETHLMLFFGNELTGVSDGVFARVKKANPDFNPPSKIKDFSYRQATEKCFRQFGYSGAYYMFEKVPVCKVCPRYAECIAETFPPVDSNDVARLQSQGEAGQVKLLTLLDERKALGFKIYIENLERGANDRINGNDFLATAVTGS